MQILHPFAGSIHQYSEAISDPDRYRPDHCPQCEAKQALEGHGFYQRTLVDVAFDGVIRVRRYLCRLCKRTVSLLPDFALPWLRFSLTVISLFLVARLLRGLTLAAAALDASQKAMPYQRGQFWIRRFRKQAPALGVALAPLTAPATAPDFVVRALHMLESIGWIAAHRFLFSHLRAHLLGWPQFLAPHGRRATLVPAAPSACGRPQSICMAAVGPVRLSSAYGDFAMDPKAEKLALFRYGLIAPLVLDPLPRGELTRRAEEIASRHYDIPDSKRRAVSVDTLLDWAARYRSGGFEALAPKRRQDRGQPRTISPQLAALIERLKRENPHRTGTTLLRELALSSGQDEPPLSASTLYRFLKQRGLSERQLLASQPHKKFEAELANQIWQADMLFGPWVQRPGGGRMQVFLHATLDDASRLIPHAQFYASQGLDAAIDCLRQAMAARGVPTRLYIDNAKMYRSPQLARIAASLGTLIIHSRPYQPEGRGKIERCFRTVREQFLANLDPKRLLSLDELNERLQSWIESIYHRSEHSALGTTPLRRWQRDIEHVRQLPPGCDLRRLFLHRLDRLVRRDSTFLMHGRLYEAPAHLAGHTVEVRFDPTDTREVEIWLQEKLQAAARSLDPVVNGQLPSAKPAAPALPEPTGINFVELVHEKQPDEDEEDVPW